MSETEPREILRRFCQVQECRVWKAIQKAKKRVPESELRQYCSETCPAYQFNRWLFLSNMKIIERSGREKYGT